MLIPIRFVVAKYPGESRWRNVNAMKPHPLIAISFPLTVHLIL